MTNWNNEQKLINHIRSFLMVQGVKSDIASDNGITDRSCQYRGDNNTCCAVGCLIPQHLYKPEIEGAVVGDLLLDRPSIAKFIESSFNVNQTTLIDILSHCQLIHDIEDLEDWWDEFQKLIDKYADK